jgi:hypothetical protein
MFSTSSFKNRRSAVEIVFHFRISYLVFLTLYMVPGTLILLSKLHTHRIDAIADAALVGGAIGKAVP